MRASYLRWAALFFLAACGGETQDKSPSALITELCGDAVELPCRPFDTQSECEAELHEGRARAAEMHCGAELDEVISCGTRFPLTCPPGSSAPKFSPECDEAMAAFERCNDDDRPPTPVPPSGSAGAGGTGSDPTCGISIGPGAGGGVSCMHNCRDFAATCEGPSQTGPLNCICTHGPQTGRAFGAADCSGGLIAASTEQCATP
jgi:hypothetical protein